MTTTHLPALAGRNDGSELPICYACTPYAKAHDPAARTARSHDGGRPYSLQQAAALEVSGAFLALARGHEDSLTVGEKAAIYVALAAYAVEVADIYLACALHADVAA